MRQQRASLQHLHIAPRKVRLLADTLRGLSASEAEAQLLLRPQRASRPLLKLLRSAVANAVHNQKIAPESLVISAIRVNDGPMLKRMLPRAMGRATPIHKKMSHVEVTLSEVATTLKPRFTILPPPKKGKKVRKKSVTPKNVEAKAERPKEKAGFFKRLFRRKAI